LETGIRTGVGGKPRLVETIAYDCDDSSFVVTKLDGEGGLWVFLPEETRHLSHVPTASGARYSDGTVSVWSKGNEAMISTPDSERHCVENRQRSIIEDAKLRGNDFWATGNNPAWTLEIGPEFTVLSVDNGQTIYTMLTRPPETSLDARRTTWIVSTQGAGLRIVVEGDPCIDTMSGTLFESSVTVTIDEDRTLYGCGQALH
jgi:membrane-bound inhibitor of C-type lysozyme